MGTPYEITKSGIVVPGGMATVIPLEFHGRARIEKLIVTQMAGLVDNFTVELFNHSDAMEATHGSDSSSDDQGNRVPLNNYLVASPFVGSAGGLRWFAPESTGGGGYLFINQNDNAGRQGQKERKLYVRISPAGIGSKTFAVTVAGETLVGGV